MEAFSKSGTWLKGNLHLHSTLSDGKKAPEELFALYKKANYDFLSLTDHWLVSKAGEHEGMILIPGAELNSQHDGKEMTHLVGIGIKSVPAVRAGDALYRHVIGHSNFVILAHPNWSSLDFATFPFLKEIHALEVFNTGCELEIGKGHSEYFWDMLLERGIRINAVANDDAHERFQDYCKSFVMVKTKEKTAEAILAALKAGQFYSSNGPLFKDITMENRKITVKTATPCREIKFICNLWNGAYFRAETKEGITEAVFAPKDKITYCRVEIVDLESRKAWSNPVFFQ